MLGLTGLVSFVPHALVFAIRAAAAAAAGHLKEALRSSPSRRPFMLAAVEIVCLLSPFSPRPVEENPNVLLDYILLWLFLSHLHSPNPFFFYFRELLKPAEITV